jgi:hypothetical protein
MQTASPAWYFIDAKWKERIWFPKLIIENMQEFETVSSITNNEMFQITRIQNRQGDQKIIVALSFQNQPL